MATAQLVPPELLQKSPSQEDGIGAATEEQLRNFGVETIQRSGVLLRLPQLTVVTAALMFHRFYYRKSFADCDVRAGAAGALLLACKIDEHPRKLQDVVMVFHRVQMREAQDEGSSPYARKPTPFLDPASREYLEMKQDVVRAERHMFREVGFEVTLLLEHPHKYVLQYLSSLNRPKSIAQKAWNFLNDSMRTTLCCEFRPQQIATASIFLAARSVGMKLPAAPKPWWEVIDADAEGMQRIATIMMALYRGPPAEYVFIPRKKRAAPLPPATPAEPPATPVVETPAPALSPSDEDEDPPGNDANLTRTDSLQADPSRIAEMLAEGGRAELLSMAPPAVPAGAGGKRLAGSDRGVGPDEERRRAAGGRERETVKERVKDRDKDRARERERERKEKADKERDRRKEKGREREWHEWEKERSRDKLRERERNDKDREKRRSCSRSRSRSCSVGHKAKASHRAKAKDRRSASPSSSTSTPSHKKGRRRRKVRSEDI